jgi:NADP-dependent 3-hydroxy acid dehydrogenase YdfG
MAKQPRILAGETAAITGAARGIGRATAQALLGQGMKVAIGDVDVDAARKTAEELGPSAVALALDVTDRDSFAAFLEETERQLGPLDVLVNNAGIMQVGRFIDEDDLTAQRQVDINIHGVILGMKLALARMIPRDRGQIVNISSQAGKFGAPGGATYSATKHAVVGLTEAVRGELRLMGAHIDLSYVMPYVVKTELGAGLGEARGLSNLEPSDVAEAIVEALQLGLVEVWVPKSSKRTNILGAVLPRRLSEGMARAMKADRVLVDADANSRRAYELRASRSEPALPGAADTPQIPSSVAASPAESEPALDAPSPRSPSPPTTPAA